MTDVSVLLLKPAGRRVRNTEEGEEYATPGMGDMDMGTPKPVRNYKEQALGYRFACVDQGGPGAIAAPGPLHYGGRPPAPAAAATSHPALKMSLTMRHSSTVRRGPIRALTRRFP